MRTLLMTIFWISCVGNVCQLLIFVSAAGLVFTGVYSVFDLNFDVFLTLVAPWLHWVKSILTYLFGEFGVWILSFPVMVISPIKFILGVIIGWWAYSTAKTIPG